MGGGTSIRDQRVALNFQSEVIVHLMIFNRNSSLCFRWNIVVNGGIDGYSRLIPYLQAATDNHAETALGFFFDGVRRYGIPSRI